MTNGYNFNALTNTLTISESFAKKASKVGSPEYRIILKLRRDCPELTIQQAEKKEGKKGLTYSQMEAFIGEHRNAAELKAKFEKVKKLSRIQPMPYKYVKTWFENNFPSIEEKGFLTFFRETEMSALSDTFWDVTLPQNLETTSDNSPSFNTFLAAQINLNKNSLFMHGTMISDLLNISGDVHHIFPKAYLKKSGVDAKARYNQVGIFSA